MIGAPKVPRYVAFGLAMVVAVAGVAFIVAETFTDPGGLAAVGLVAAWGLPMVALSVYALQRPVAATPVVVAVAVLVSLFVVLEEALHVLPQGAGPVGSIAVFAVAVAVDFLGLHRPVPAGSLLVLLGVANLGAGVWRVTASDEEAGVRAGLGGSSGAVAMAVLVVAALFLLAGAWEAWTDHRAHRVRSAH